MPIPTMASPAMLAVQAKVDTLKKQGMPAAQIGQILQTEVLPTGAVPISQLWQLMNYVKANSQATQAPPADSVAVQLADRVKQMAMAKSHPLGPVPQMGQQAQPPFPPSGLPSMPLSAGPPPPGGPPPGVAGIPQESVGQPGAYAGGGIVSFSGPDDQLVGDPAPDEYSGDFWGGWNRLHSIDAIPGISGLPYGGVDPRKRLSREQLQQMYATGQMPEAASVPVTPAAQTATDGAGIPYSLGRQPQPGAFAGPYQLNFGQMGPTPPTRPLPNDGLNGRGGASSGSSLGIGSLVRPKDIPVGADPTIDEITTQAQAAADKMGLGSMAKEANRYAADEEAKSAKDNKYDRNLTLAQAGFAMAEAASRGGATFLGSAGAGGSVLAKGLMAAKEKQDQQSERIEDLKLKALDAADRGKEGIFKTSMEQLQAKIGENKADIRSNAQTAVEWMKVNGQIIIERNHDAVYRAVADKNDPALRGYQLAVAQNPTEENIAALNHYIMMAYPEVVAAVLNNKNKQELQDNSVPAQQFRMIQGGIGGGEQDMTGWGAIRHQ